MRNRFAAVTDTGRMLDSFSSVTDAKGWASAICEDHFLVFRLSRRYPGTMVLVGDGPRRKASAQAK